MNPPDPALDDPFSQAAQNPAGAGSFDFKAFLDTLRRLYWIVALTLVFGFVCGKIITRFIRPIYQAQSEIKAERRPSTTGVSLTGGSPAAGSPLLPEDLKTVERTFLTPELMRRVVAKLNLTARAGFLGSGRLSGTEDEVTGLLFQNSKAALIPDTILIAITFDHQDPLIATEVANALAEEGIAIDRERLAAAIQANVERLKGEAEKLNAKLTESKKKLNDYTRARGNVSVDQESDLASEKLRDLDRRATQARSERLKVESDYSEVEKCDGDTEKLASLSIVQQSPGVATLAARINELRGNLAKLEQRYRSGHPFVVQASTELKDLEDSFRIRVQDIARGVEAALAAARRSEEELLKETAEQQQKVFDIRDMAVFSQVLKGQIDVDQLAYEATLKRLSEELSQNSNQPVLLQISSLAQYAVPVSVAPRQVLLSSVFAGLLLGLAIIALITQLDTSIKTPEAAEKLLGLPVLASIPSNDHPRNPVLRWTEGASLHAPRSETAEAFRNLRTALQSVSGDEKFILITGASSGTGVTFSTINLAIALAQNNFRALLIDANLRDPAIEERGFVDQGHPGLSDFLLGRAPLSSVIFSSGIPNLDVITAGTPSAHPVEVLSRQRFHALLDGAGALYDRIIVDSASVATLSDTLCFAKNFPTVCLVIHSRHTTKSAARRAADLLTRSGVKVTGLVFNLARSAAVKDAPLSQKPLSSRVRPAGEGAGFPVLCPSCGRKYETIEDFLSLTTLPNGHAPTTRMSDPEYQLPHRERICACGATLPLKAPGRRDLTDAGSRRREKFSAVLDLLQKSGLTREEGRARLLLALKTCRNEIGTPMDDEESEAGRRRRQIFDDLKGTIERTGVAPDHARSLLLEIIEIWRQAP